MKNKIVKIVLTALLVVCIIPAGAFAAEDHNVMLASNEPETIIKDNDITWLKEESADTRAWYGLDNSDAKFPKGSRVSVRWIDKESDPQEVERYQELVDKNIEFRCKNTGQYSIWQVTDPKNEALSLQSPVQLYIQIGDDWDEEDVRAYYIDEGQDEEVEVERANVVSPDGSRNFLKLTVKHLGAPLLITEESSFAASVWTHFQPAVTIGLLLIVIIVIASAALIKKRNKSK